VIAPFAPPPLTASGRKPERANDNTGPSRLDANTAASRRYGPPRSRKEVKAMILLIIWLVRLLKRRNAS
jgi:hypothetical protein